MRPGNSLSKLVGMIVMSSRILRSTRCWERLVGCTGHIGRGAWQYDW